MTRLHPTRPTGGYPIESASVLNQLFLDTCANAGAKVAIVDKRERMSFATWRRRSNSLATALQRWGVRRGDVVAFQLPNWWETSVLFTAVTRLGAIVNPLLPILRERELAFALRQSGTAHFFVPGDYRGYDYLALARRVLDQGIQARLGIIRGTQGAEFAEALTGDPETSTSDDTGRRTKAGDLLLLMYTSGTTADPKGVLHTHASLIAEIRSLARIHGLTSKDSTLMPSPLTHISGVLHGIMCPAILGTTAVLMDRWRGDLAYDLIQREETTYMVGAPIFLQDLIATAKDQAGSKTHLRMFSCGGASVSAELMRSAQETLGCTAKRVYGSTEFPTITTTPSGDVTDRGMTTEGAPIAPNEIRIVRDGQLQPANEVGEIQARGPECFVGYADKELNREAFTDDGWFRSGDLGQIDTDGYLTVTGRMKEIVIRKGEKISVREVEQALEEHPDILEACVVGVPDTKLGERACAAVAITPGAIAAEDGLAQHLIGKGLSRQKIPEQWKIVEALPRTASGKIHRAAVRQLFENSVGASS